MGYNLTEPPTSVAIPDGTVANADLANMANKTFKGRHSSGTGVPEDVSVANMQADLGIIAQPVALAQGLQF